MTIWAGTGERAIGQDHVARLRLGNLSAVMAGQVLTETDTCRLWRFEHWPNQARVFHCLAIHKMTAVRWLAVFLDGGSVLLREHSWNVSTAPAGFV